jgi:hypothetical protein
MKRRYALFTVIFVISILIGIQVVEVVEARSIGGNPIPPPGTIPPKITISSPQNNQTYSSDAIYLTLNVTKPMLEGWSSGLRLIVYTLDGKSSRLYGNTEDPSDSFYYHSGSDYNTSFRLPPLQPGNHTIGVYAEGEVWSIPTDSTSDIIFSTTESLATTHFTTVTQQLTPAQAPTPAPTRITPGAEWGKGEIGCTIELPHNTTYTTQNVRLQLWTGIRCFYSTGSFSIDGGPETFINVGVFDGATFNTTVHLTDGNHTIRLKVYSGWNDFGGFTTVHFTVNHSLPFITLESPKNQTYRSQTIGLNYTLVNGENSEAKYCLDNKENVTVSNKLSAPQLGTLTDGTHHVVVYANDDFGNVYSTQTSFEVRSTPTAVEVAGIPVTILLVALLASIIVIITLLVFFKRRKSKSAQPKNVKLHKATATNSRQVS